MSQWDRPGFQCGFNSAIGLKSAIAKPNNQRSYQCSRQHCSQRPARERLYHQKIHGQSPASLLLLVECTHLSSMALYHCKHPKHEALPSSFLSRPSFDGCNSPCGRSSVSLVERRISRSTPRGPRFRLVTARHRCEARRGRSLPHGMDALQPNRTLPCTRASLDARTPLPTTARQQSHLLYPHQLVRSLRHWSLDGRPTCISATTIRWIVRTSVYLSPNAVSHHPIARQITQALAFRGRHKPRYALWTRCRVRPKVVAQRRGPVGGIVAGRLRTLGIRRTLVDHQ